MRWLSRFGRFWYDFIVGDDWTVAVATIAFVAITAAIAHRASPSDAWPILPIGVIAILGVSVWRALRAHQRADEPR
jgi:hypothetical protein